MRAGLVTWLVLVHAIAVFLFSRGFLLNRLALSDLSQPHDEPPQPTHKRAVLLIVDSLRFDFLSPDPPEPYNPYHHNVLTLPAELTKLNPERSFLFNAYADPPTTTLQRIKALTTGSLPTFVDAGSNFGGSAILEDSIVKQLVLANKSIAFMGDDTWLSVYPSSFHQNLTFPYDSFNVEDLHTVDLGVLTHLFPLLRNSHPSLPTTTKQNQFDFLIGHFLGVDHVGHRVGPSHPSMLSKLKQMDTALRQVVELLDEDTLLVVLGDHGMDRAGDHGGDGILETSSGMWIYSKGRPLMDTRVRVEGEGGGSGRGGVFSGLMKYTTFPGSTKRSRQVQQIDLLPTLSLLVGLPIPYNNLGSVIPELFWRRHHPTTTSGELELEKALKVNSAQIKKYLDTYRASSSGAELDNAWNALQAAWAAITTPATSSSSPSSSFSSMEMKLVSMMNYNRTALSACRLIWAQFNPILMAAGLALMITAIIATWVTYLALRANGVKWEAKLLSSNESSSSFVSQVWKVSAGGGTIGYIGFWVVGYVFGGGPVNPIEGAVFVGGMIGCVFGGVYIAARGLTLDKFWRFVTPSGLFAVLILGLHTLSFFSNSFTFWEDKVVLWLCASTMVPFILWGFAAPGLSPTSPSSRTAPSGPDTTKSSKTTTTRTGIFAKLGLTSLKGKILGFTFLFLICIRLMALFTVCREEQGAYCHVTFYATPPTVPLSATSSPLSSLSDPLPSDPSIDITTPSEMDSAPQPMPILTTSTTPPTWSLTLSLPTALIFPFLISRVLNFTKSDNGIAPVMVWGVVTPSLVASWTFWMLEWAESGGIQPDSHYPLFLTIIEEVVRLRTVRSWIARIVVGWIGMAFVGWWVLPVCLDIRVTLRHSGEEEREKEEKEGAQVAVLGYANAYGAPYLLFYLLGFSLVYLCTPLPGQVVLGLSGVALVAYLEAVDAVGDAKEIKRVVERTLNLSAATTQVQGRGGRDEEEEGEEEPTTFLTTLPLILLSFITFYATGHQSTISSLQWKTGFVLSESVRYPWSVMSVVANSSGPFLLLGCAGGALLGSWKRSPSSSFSTPTNTTKTQVTPTPISTSETNKTKDNNGKLGQDVEHSALLTTLLIQLYFLMLLLGTSLSAAILRRHLMVWKVFAPRFMAAVIELGVVDLGMLVAWGVNGAGEYSMIERVVERIGWVLGRVGIGSKEKDE